MNMAITSLIAALVIAGLTTIMVYIRGTRWWSYPIGRALMLKSCSLTTIYVYILIRRLTTPNPPLPDHTGQFSLAVYSLLLAVELALAGAFYYEWQKYRHIDRMGSHDSDTTTR